MHNVKDVNQMNHLVLLNWIHNGCSVNPGNLIMSFCACLDVRPDFCCDQK